MECRSQNDRVPTGQDHIYNVSASHPRSCMRMKTTSYVQSLRKRRQLRAKPLRTDPPRLNLHWGILIHERCVNDALRGRELRHSCGFLENFNYHDWMQRRKWWRDRRSSNAFYSGLRLRLLVRTAEFWMSRWCCWRRKDANCDQWGPNQSATTNKRRVQREGSKHRWFGRGIAECKKSKLDLFECEQRQIWWLWWRCWKPLADKSRFRSRKWFWVCGSTELRSE